MDGREGMALQGSASYHYFNSRGIGGGGGGGSPGSNVHGVVGDSVSGPSVFKGQSNHNFQLQHPNVVVVSTGGGGSGGGGGGGSTFVENPSHNFAAHGGGGMSGPMVAPPPSGPSGGVETTVKKKRGRPRKYGPDGSGGGGGGAAGGGGGGGANMSLGLSPLSAPRPPSGEITPGEKPRKGRPPGSGWKQRLAHVGEWMNSSAGLAFTPHVLHIGIGEDVAAKILAFAQQRPRALCILSATGSVSTVTLRQPTNSGGTLTYEGRFEILCLSGSYLVSENGSPSNRTGGISISFSSPDGHILGGAIGGRLIASNPVQVVTCSFIYGGTKPKGKPESETKDEKFMLVQSGENASSTPVQATPNRSPAPNSGPSGWPSGSQVDAKNSEIDLSR